MYHNNFFTTVYVPNTDYTIVVGVAASGAIYGEYSAKTENGPGLLEVTGLAAPQIGDLAAAHGIAIHELTPQRASLEEAFMKLTNDAIEFHGGTTAEMTGITGQRVAA